MTEEDKKEEPLRMILPDCCTDPDGREDCIHVAKREEKRPINPAL